EARGSHGGSGETSCRATPILDGWNGCTRKHKRHRCHEQAERYRSCAETTWTVRTGNRDRGPRQDGKVRDPPDSHKNHAASICRRPTPSLGRLPRLHWRRHIVPLPRGRDESAPTVSPRDQSRRGEDTHRYLGENGSQRRGLYERIQRNYTNRDAGGLHRSALGKLGRRRRTDRGQTGTPGGSRMADQETRSLQEGRNKTTKRHSTLWTTRMRQDHARE